MLLFEPFKRFFVFTLVVSGFVIAPLSLADTPETTSQAPVVSPIPQGYMTCPNIKQIYSDPRSKTWTAHNGWKSYDTSFAKGIKTFLGAQWQGTNIGDVFCLYQSTDEMTFAVKLQYHHLVYEPTGGQWKKATDGILNCYSTDPQKCLFKSTQAQKKSDVYDTLQNLKGAPAQELGF